MPASLATLLVHADARKFRVGEGAPREVGVVGLSRQVEYGVAQHNAPFISGGMGKLVFACDVACSIDMLMGCPQPVVDLQSLFYRNPLICLQPQTRPDWRLSQVPRVSFRP